MKIYTFEQYQKEFNALVNVFMQTSKETINCNAKLIYSDTAQLVANDMADLEEEYPDFAKIYENQYNY